MEVIVLESFNVIKKTPDGEDEIVRVQNDVRSKVNIDYEEVKVIRELIIPGTRRHFKDRFFIEGNFGNFVVLGDRKKFIRDREIFLRGNKSNIVVKGFIR